MVISLIIGFYGGIIIHVQNRLIFGIYVYTYVYTHTHLCSNGDGDQYRKINEQKQPYDKYKLVINGSIIGILPVTMIETYPLIIKLFSTIPKPIINQHHLVSFIKHCPHVLLAKSPYFMAW